MSEKEAAMDPKLLLLAAILGGGLSGSVLAGEGRRGRGAIAGAAGGLAGGAAGAGIAHVLPQLLPFIGKNLDKHTLVGAGIGGISGGLTQEPDVQRINLNKSVKTMHNAGGHSALGQLLKLD